MKIDNEFTVSAPIDRAWAVLTDVETIAPCMPGAQLTGIQDVDGSEVYEGKVKVKIGPVVSEFKGTATFIEKDDEKYRGVIDAKGRDTRGAGNASATIVITLASDGESTRVTIDTDLKISGKVAQFGAGMIKEVSAKLLGQFVDCLEGKLVAPVDEPEELKTPTAVTAEPLPSETAVSEPALAEPALAEPPAATSAAAPAEVAPVETAPVVEPASALAPPVVEPVAPAQPAARNGRTFAPTAEAEALDLLDLAGGAAAKRLIPVAIGAGLVVAAAIIYIATR
jgi:carbon monoxide dehydrogenase subunit G